MTNEEKITKFLKDKYNPQAIILHGSRAIGKEKPESDWDIFVAVDKKTENELDWTFEHNHLDVVIIQLPLKDSSISNYYKRVFFTAKLLYDKDDQGQRLINRIHTLSQKGCNLTKKAIAGRKRFIERRLQRMIDNVDNEAIFFYHLGIFYGKAIESWFEVLNNRWSIPIYESLPLIKEKDSDYYRLLEDLISQKTSSKDKIKSSKKIVKKLF